MSIFIYGTIIELTHLDRAFIVQGIGGSVASGTSDDMKVINLGLHIYTGGIAVQELFVLIFCAMVFYIYRKLGREGAIVRPTSWRLILKVMTAALVFITVGLLSYIKIHALTYV